MQTYTLPTILTVNGTVTIEITSISEGLTQPTIQTVRSIGKRVESAVINGQESEVPRLTMTVMQDTAGFWVGMVYVNSYFFITLTEADTVERHFFSGHVELETVDWGSDSNISGSRTGEITFTILSDLRDFFDVSTEAWVTAVKAHAITLAEPVGVHPWKVISVRGLFAAMLHAGDYNADYSLDYVDFVSGTNKDFVFKDGVVNDFDVSQLYVDVSYKDGGGSSAYTSYFLDGDALYLPDKYGSLKELLGVILRNFGLRIQMYYDMDDDKYKLHLIQSYRAYDGTLDFNDSVTGLSKLKEEKQSTSMDIIGDGCRATFCKEPTYFVWQSASYGDMLYHVTDPPASMTFDYDTMVLWHVTSGANQDGNPERLYGHANEIAAGDPYTDLNNIIDVTWHNYNDGSDDIAADPSGNSLKLEQALVGYNGSRIIRGAASSTPGWFKNVSKYYGITAVEGAVESFSNITILKRQTLSLGFGAGNKNYYANKIKLDLDASEVEVDWIQEELS